MCHNILQFNGWPAQNRRIIVLDAKKTGVSTNTIRGNTCHYTVIKVILNDLSDLLRPEKGLRRVKNKFLILK
jgi:hypothetical protein